MATADAGQLFIILIIFSLALKVIQCPAKIACCYGHMAVGWITLHVSYAHACVNVNKYSL